MFSLAISRSPWSTWISTTDWLSATVVKTFVFLVGIVELRSISFSKTPPCVSMPSESGVTSSRTTSLISPLSTPPWIAAPIATTSSGLISRLGSRPKSSATMRCTLGVRVWPPTRMTWSTSEGLRPAGRSASRHGAAVRSIRSATSASKRSRVSVRLMCLGPDASAEMNGRVMVVSFAVESSHLAFSAASLSRCRAMRSWRRSMPVDLLEVVEQPVHDLLVEVLAAEVRVAGRGLDLEDPVAELQDRDVERAAAEVVDGDGLAALAVEAVRERRGRRLVDDAQDLEARRCGRRRAWPGAARRRSTPGP